MAEADIQRPPSGGIGGAVAAANRRARNSLLRNHGGGHAPVSNLELFFDLVFVFAITQISHFMHHHLGWVGMIEGALLFLAVWWAWMYTTWATNWANPDRLSVRIMLLALMLLSLGLSASLPEAFAGQAAIFAGCYVALQLGRSLTMVAIFNGEGVFRVRNMQRIACWFVFSAPMWAAGVFDTERRLIWWAAALALEYAGPMAMFRVPGLGRSLASDWDISGSHMAERCSLFIIIALGEGIVVTGSNLADQTLSSGLVSAFIIAFAGSALMWWLYFDLGAERGARLIAGHEQAGRVARNAYTYLHMPIVLGIIIAAVGDALLLEQWHEPASPAFIAVQCGGLMLFLIGVGLFKRFSNTFGNYPFSHLIALMMFAALGLYGWLLPPSAASFAALCVAVLLITAIWEWVSYNGGWLERMEARGWRFATWLRARNQRRMAAREAKRLGGVV